MHWHRVDPVQAVDALLLEGADAPVRLAALLASKPPAVRDLPVAFGEDWAAIFAQPVLDESERILPRITGAQALYRAAEGWWFPVGCELAIPRHAQAELLAHFAQVRDLAPPLIAIPRFGPDGLAVSADILPIRRLAPLAVEPAG